MAQLDSVASNAAITMVTPSTTAAQLLPVNAARKGLLICNNATGTLSIAFGATATTTAYSVLLPAATGVYQSNIDYTGIVTGIWSTTGGTCAITEFS